MSQAEADFQPRRYQVRHTTTYEYDAEVVGCYERGFLSLRATPHQVVVALDVDISPEPDVVSTHVDFFGNESYYVEARSRHTTFSVTMLATVDVAWPRVDLAHLNRWTVSQAAALADSAAGPDLVTAAIYRLPSQLIEITEEVAAFARGILAPDRPLGDALAGLYGTIYRDFAYTTGATSVKTTLPEILELKAGVCQDFAHLAIGALRSVGLPARYVSGYIETTAAPGTDKLAGSDATHAWVSTWTPGGTWVDLDPTNDHFADSRYIVTAWGRDYRDVSPLKGIIFTESKKSTMTVAVDVTTLAPAPLAPAPLTPAPLTPAPLTNFC
ncbi:MAG: transglutaminase family protein [Nostocoides sp.]